MWNNSIFYNFIIGCFHLADYQAQAVFMKPMYTYCIKIVSIYEKNIVKVANITGFIQNSS